MVEINWSEITSFERYPKLQLSKGQKVEGVVFQDDGSFVTGKTLKQAGAKHPKDSFVFVVAVGKELKEFWLNAQAFSTSRQLKQIRDNNNSTLKGAKATIERVSEDPAEANYKITGEI